MRDSRKVTMLNVRCYVFPLHVDVLKLCLQYGQVTLSVRPAGTREPLPQLGHTTVAFEGSEISPHFIFGFSVAEMPTSAVGKADGFFRIAPRYHSSASRFAGEVSFNTESSNVMI